MISDIAFKLGDMYGAFDEDGTMVGFQAWVPPGKALFESYVSESRRSVDEPDAEAMLSSDEDKAQLGPYIEQLPSDEVKAFVLHTVGDTQLPLDR